MLLLLLLLLPCCPSACFLFLSFLQLKAAMTGYVQSRGLYIVHDKVGLRWSACAPETTQDNTPPWTNFLSSVTPQ